ncbi:unnamed protein product [Rangifer tarandus platyrhynchus]|uniref:Uncharacterized protein n=1 Tax=Rangifer tarandus platyrhynchus TaxID=3082113 RepID=A0AC59YMS3_RANTA
MPQHSTFRVLDRDSAREGVSYAHPRFQLKGTIQEPLPLQDGKWARKTEPKGGLGHHAHLALWNGVNSEWEVGIVGTLPVMPPSAPTGLSGELNSHIYWRCVGRVPLPSPWLGPLNGGSTLYLMVHPARKTESGEDGDQGPRGSFMASVVELCGSWQAGEQGSLDAAVATASLEDCAPQPSWYNRCGESVKLDALGVEKGQVGPWK